VVARKLVGAGLAAPSEEHRPAKIQKIYVKTIDVKNVFTFFLIFQTFFLFLKNFGKVQINNKHFQNNSNEIDNE